MVNLLSRFKEKVGFLDLVIVGLFILAIFSLIQGVLNGLQYSQDSMWPHIRLLINGINPYEVYLYNPNFYDNLGFSEFFGRGVHYPPSVLYLMSPLAIVSDPFHSKIILVIVNVLSSILILFVFKKMVSLISNREFLIIVALFYIGLPFRNTLGVGQNGLIAVAFLMLSLLLSEKKVLSGIFLSLSLIKYTLTAPFVIYFIYKKQYSAVLIAGLIHLILNLYGAHVLGLNLIDLTIMVLNTTSGLENAGFIDIMSLTSNITIRLALYALLTLIIGYSILKGKLSISILSILSLLIVYHRIYDYFVLILLYPMMNFKPLKSAYYYLLIHFFVLVRIFEWIDIGQSTQRLISIIPISLFVMLEVNTYFNRKTETDLDTNTAK
jgi:hypothetical protein